MALSDKFGTYGALAAEAARKASVVGGVGAAAEGVVSLIGDVARKNALKKQMRVGERKAKQGGAPNQMANLMTGLASTLKSPMTERMPGSAGVGYSGRRAGDRLEAIKSGQEQTLATAGQLVGQQRRGELDVLQKDRERDQAEIKKINQEMLKKALTGVGGAASAYAAVQQSPEAQEKREKRQEIRAEDFAKGRLPHQVRAQKRWAKKNPSRVLPEATGGEIVDAVEGVDFTSVIQGEGLPKVAARLSRELGRAVDYNSLREANPQLEAKGWQLEPGEQLNIPK